MRRARSRLVSVLAACGMLGLGCAAGAMGGAPRVPGPDAALGEELSEHGIAPSVQGPAANERKGLGVPRGAAQGDAERKTPIGGEAGDSAYGWLRTVGSTALVVVLAAVVLVVARRLAPVGGLAGARRSRAPAGILELLGRYPIGRGQMLLLLKVDRRIVLLSQSGSGYLRGSGPMSVLCEITDPEEVAAILVRSRDEAGDSIAARFRTLLDRASGTVESEREVVEVGIGAGSGSIRGGEGSGAMALRERLRRVTSGRAAAGGEAGSRGLTA
ncbi:MAG: flagellar biosynthetic protein FliO [Phycisphaerae bacterium]|nr:flagellar biosynthetic protein FliO [Phycisphaerae bacterium]